MDVELLEPPWQPQLGPEFPLDCASVNGTYNAKQRMLTTKSALRPNMILDDDM